MTTFVVVLAKGLNSAFFITMLHIGPIKAADIKPSFRYAALRPIHPIIDGDSIKQGLGKSKFSAVSIRASTSF